MPISDKQQAFVNNYCTNGHNASKAYKNAYPNCKSGYNAHGAREIAKDSVKQAIRAFMDETSDTCKLTATSIITRLQQLSGLTPIKAGDTALPATTDAGQIRSLDLLGKHLKLWDRAGEDNTGDTALALSKEALQALREQAAIVNKQSISKPTLYKDKIVMDGDDVRVERVKQA